MPFQRDGYYYDQQLKRYVLQFMHIFSGLQVQIGKWNTEDERLISVPIHYGHQDRVVASILADNVQNKPIRLPILSAYVLGLSLDSQNMHGTGVERRTAHVPLGGLVPNDVSVIHQLMPVPYTLEIELAIYASNTDQHFQILEQILPLFDPQLNIQLSDGLFDWARLTSVELTSGPNMDTNYPIGVDRRIVQSRMTFKMPIRIGVPAQVKQDFVEKIFMRIGAISGTALTNQEIIADLDAQGLDYTLAVDANNIEIQ